MDERLIHGAVLYIGHCDMHGLTETHAQLRGSANTCLCPTAPNEAVAGQADASAEAGDFEEGETAVKIAWEAGAGRHTGYGGVGRGGLTLRAEQQRNPEEEGLSATMELAVEATRMGVSRSLQAGKAGGVEVE